MPDTCPKCSTAVDADAIFCPSCAASINPTCPSCQKPVISDAKFCKYCAFDLSQATPAASTENARVVSANQSASPSPQYSGLDALLSDKYHAMSDSQLLTMLKGDISGQTEKSLSIALAELEARTNIDWREMSIAKTRVKEAIIAANSHSSVGSYASTPRYSASGDSAREKAERLAKAGGITAGVSALLFLWGYSYRSSFGNAAMNLFGLDPTYQLAGWCVAFGTIGFFVGLILFVVGMAQRSS